MGKESMNSSMKKSALRTLSNWKFFMNNLIWSFF